MTNAQIAHIRARSALLLRFVSLLAAALWLTFLLERFGAVSLRLAAHSGDAAAWRAFAVQGVLAIPELLYLLALGGVRRALGEFARGQLFVPAVTRMLQRIGVLLAAGAGMCPTAARTRCRTRLLDRLRRIGTGAAHWGYR